MKRLLACVVAGMLGLVCVPAAAQAVIATTPLPTASEVVGTTLSDSVTVSGLTNAIQGDSTVTFTLFAAADTACALPLFTDGPVALAIDGTATSGTATSGGVTPDAGSYQWVASYSGDANNPADPGTCNDPAEAQTVTQAQPLLGTAATSVTLGAGDITDIATVSGLVNPTAGGSVTFNLFGPGDTTCATPLLTDTEAIVLNAPLNTIGTSQPNPAFTPASAGDHHWTASYSGDVNNAPAAGVCLDAGETSTVAKATPALTTLAEPPSPTLGGGTISDSATVTGIVNPVAVPQTVTFRLYDPADTTCTGAPLVTEPAVLNAGTAAAAPFTPQNAGVYRWIATYNGDANNNVVRGACNDPTETRTVAPAQPGIATAASGDIVLGGQITDSATVSGLVNQGGGNVTFLLFGPGDANCTGDLADSAIVSIPSAPLSDITVSTAGFTPTAAGVYRWRAIFNGDPNNNVVAGPCNAAGESVTVAKATPVIVTAASAGVSVGAGSLLDNVAVAGVAGTAPTGTVTFSLYGPDDAGCTGGSINAADTQALTVDGPNAIATSAAFAPTAAGVYRWRATFGGDANYTTTAAPCNAANESVTVSPFVAPPPAPPPPPAVPPPPPAAVPPPPPGPSRPTCDGRPATIVATGQAEVTGTARADVIVGTAGAESIDGGGGDDTICARGGADKIRGGAGDDTIHGANGNDRIRGDAGKDTLFGDAGADSLLGGAGDDDVRGGAGKDSAAGGDGSDRVDGGSGDDTLDEQRLGGKGADRIFGGTGADHVRTAGGGTDVVDCGANTDSVLLDRNDSQKACERVTR